MSSIISEQSPGPSNGILSENEQLFLRQLRYLLDATMQGRVPFVMAMENLLLDLKEIRKHGFDADAVLASGVEFNVGRAALPASAPARARPTDAEREFLHDMDGLIDYAVRSGVTFLTLIRPLVHDAVELKGYGWSLEQAKADFFLPAVTGWTARNLQPAGQSEEFD